MTVYVAGRSLSGTFINDPASIPTLEVVWDGKDAYERQVQGEQEATITRCIGIPGVGYATPEAQLQSFSQINGKPMVTFRYVGQYSGVFDLCSSAKTKVGMWDNRAAALGGWRLSAHHALDVPNRTVYRGDGGVQKVDDAIGAEIPMASAPAAVASGP